MPAKQKFQKGNLVKVLNHDGELAVIEGSYADLHWGNDRDNFSIVFMEKGNSLAWVDKRDMELVDSGGDHLLREAEENKEKQLNNTPT